MAEDCHRQHTRKRRTPQDDGCPPCDSPAAAARQHDRADRKTFRNLVQEDRQENDPSEPIGHQKPGCDGNPVKECMDDQPKQDRVSGMRMHKLIMVRLLTKMKMWSHRVLEEMNDEVAKQYQQGGRFPPYFQALRN